jgi:hypothetical protein
MTAEYKNCIEHGSEPAGFRGNWNFMCASLAGLNCAVRLAVSLGGQLAMWRACLLPSSAGIVLEADEGTSWKEELILQQLRCTTHVRSPDSRSVSLSEALKRISEVRLRNSSGWRRAGWICMHSLARVCVCV